MSLDYPALARRFIEETWNQRRPDAIDELITPDSVSMTEAGPVWGADAFKAQVWGPFLSAVPDLRLTIEGTVAEGAQVVIRWVAAGTHTGPGLGMPPSGRSFTARGMTWIRYEGGKMKEGWDCWNVTGLLHYLRTGENPPSPA